MGPCYIVFQSLFCPKNIYIYIYTHAKLTFWGVGKREVFGEVLERFLERFWRGFGEVFRDNFDIFVILLCISCWKGFGKGFGRNLNSF